MQVLPDLAVQAFFGIAVLGVAVALGYQRCLRDRAQPLDAKARATLLLLLLAGWGGGIGAVGWFTDDARSFAWDLPPLASRMLGAAGLAFAVLALAVLRRPSRARVSLALLALAVYLVPIALAAVLAHLDRFDFRVPLTWAFFLIVALMSSASVWLLASPSPAIARWLDDSDLRTPPAFARGLLAATSLLTLTWAVALFVTDAGPTRLIWAWPGDLLTSRLISVMLLTIGIGGLASLRSVARARSILLFDLAYGAGVLAAGALQGWHGKPLPLAYMTGFGALALLAGLASSRCQ